MKTIYDAVRIATERFPDNDAVVVPPRAGRDYAEAGLVLTYRQLHDLVLSLSSVYNRGGYGTGHRVALLVDSRPDMLYHLYALNRLGASIVPINPDYKREETLYVLEHSEADLIVVLPRHLEHVEAVCRGMAKPPAIVLLDDASDAVPAPARARTSGIPGLATEAAILYTSGTTAAPKGCIAENEYALFMAHRYSSAGGVIAMEEGRERLFNPLPLYYVNSLLGTTVTMLLKAGCCIYPDRFHVRSWWDDMAATRPTMLQHLGIVLPALYSLPPSERERTHGIRVAIGAGIEPTKHREYEERFNFPIVELWGMTECGIASIACHEPRHVGSRSIGHPLAETEFRVIGDDDAEMPVGEIGELVVRRSGDDPRAGMVRTYLKDNAATDAAWRNGWFHTGDLVLKNADGSYTFVGRKKEVIRRSGQNIAASEIESALTEHPDVLQAACIAAPDDMREEEVLACLIVRPGVERSNEKAIEIAASTIGKLAYFKIPGWVSFFDTFPVTVSQKLQKRALFPVGQDPRTAAGVYDVRHIKQNARVAG